ncbi:hypothetical protein [Streptomyces indicus]|uniref:Secreted protein n=1 Tax=Streptomyces indicus TaxID=417292 RepID=A0A1G9HK56_9ACTN|nr:hypothetical protein [Streptomyces indicus]SDL13347.1 hypothetical protein SAMN05421806_11947 [Streptomyces indicus]
MVRLRRVRFAVVLVAVVLALTGFQAGSTSGGKGGSGKSKSSGGGGGCSSGKSRSSSSGGDTDRDDAGSGGSAGSEDDPYGDSGYDWGLGTSDGPQELSAEDQATARIAHCAAEDAKKRRKGGKSAKPAKRTRAEVTKVEVRSSKGGTYTVGVGFTYSNNTDGTVYEEVTLKPGATRTVTVTPPRKFDPDKLDACELVEFELR